MMGGRGWKQQWENEAKKTSRAELEDWKERFLLAAENALRSRPKDEEALKDEQIKKLKQKIGDLVMDIDILKEAAKHHPPMSGTSEL